MLSLVLALVVSQTVSPPDAASGRGVVVISSRSQGLTPIEVVTLAERLSKSLEDARVQVAMRPDEAVARLGPQRRPESCQGRSECLAGLGRTLGVGAVVALDSSKVFDDLPMRIMLLDTRQGEILLRRSYTISAVQPSELDTVFQGVSQEIKTKLLELPGFGEPPPSDAPKEPAPVVLIPEPVQAPPPALVAPAPAQPSRVPVYLARGGAAVAGGAAVFFLVQGLRQGSELQREQAPGVSSWTYTQATERRNDANRQLLLSGIVAGVAGALLTTSFLLPTPPPAE